MTRALCALSLLAFAAPAMAAPLSAGPLTLEFTTPGGSDLQSIALGAMNQLTVHDRVFVEGTLGSTGALPTRLGNDSEVDGAIVSIPSVRIGHRTMVSGAVESGGPVSAEASSDLAAGAFLTQFGDDDVHRLDYTVPSTSAGTLRVPHELGTVLVEERYDRITVSSRAELVLTTGVWFVDHLTVEPQGTIRLDDSSGPIILVVGQSFRFSGTWQDDTNDGEGPRLVVAYDGTQGILLDQPFDGILVAPEARVTLAGNGITHDGAFFANDIVVRPGIGVTQRLFPLVGNPCDSLGPVLPFADNGDLGNQFKPPVLCVP